MKLKYDFNFPIQAHIEVAKDHTIKTNLKLPLILLTQCILYPVAPTVGGNRYSRTNYTIMARSGPAATVCFNAALMSMER